MSGMNEGKEAVLQALGQIGENFEKFHVSPDELVEEGDTVVVLSTSMARRSRVPRSSCRPSRSGA